MNRWNAIRPYLLAITFSSTVLVLLKVWLHPHQPQNLAQTSFDFPEAIALPEWQLLSSERIKLEKEPTLIASRRYRYQQNNLTLEIDIHYATQTLGDVKSWLSANAVEKASLDYLQIKEKPGIGFYGLLQSNGKAYLSSCINPRGGTTVTIDQFRRNRNQHEIQFDRILPWLLGKGDLRDWRCLLTAMSLPAEPAQAKDAYQRLETAWFAWHDWWRSRFPQP